MAKFEEDTLSYKQLLLNPNNYRYQDNPDFVYADEKRFHEKRVQEKAYGRLKSEESLVQLKNSFITNGFIPVERLVARRYLFDEDKYLVLEGNRRLAALKWIAEDDESGVAIPDSILKSLKAVPVIIVEDVDDPAFYEALMGVRHVSGIKEWGGYQRAKLVAALRDDHDLETSQVADRLGMSAIEVNRRYRAFTALQQMQGDENYGMYAKPPMYALFHEAVAIPMVREWLGWEEDLAKFTDDTHRDQFYELITPSEDEEAGRQDAKITSYAQVRELRSVLASAEAKRILLDPNRSFMDALTVAKRDELSRSWKTQVAEAIDALHSIAVLDLGELSSEDVTELERLIDAAQKLLDTYRKLAG